MSNNIIKKIFAVLLIIGLNWSGIFAVGDSLAYFSDTEESVNNSFEISVLDFSLGTADNFSDLLTPDQDSQQTISIIDDGNLGFEYRAFATSTSGSLCDYINLEAKLDGTTVYNGALDGFDYTAGTFSATTTDWTFIASLASSDNALQNQICDFDFEFDGGQIDAGGLGFSDVETVSNSIVAGEWQSVWIQTTSADFEAGESSLYGSEEEIFVEEPGDASIAVGAVIPPKTASFSGSNDPTHLPELAIDSDMNTYWKAIDASDDDWFGVDLGEVHPVAGVSVYFKKEAKDYQIKVSETGDFSGEETTVVSITGNTDSEKQHSFIEIDARYIRIYMTKINGNPSIYEFEVTKRELPSFDGEAVLTSQIFDAVETTKWDSLEWDETLATSTDITFRAAVSNNGTTWTWYNFGSDNSAIDLSSLSQARYFKWEATLHTDKNAVPVPTPILHEVRVYYSNGDEYPDVVLNEFLPNPDGVYGEDGDDAPYGEWIELYNNSDVIIDVAGWYIRDASSSGRVNVELFNTYDFSINASSTEILPHNWLVVYTNKSFLNNVTGGDVEEIKLYNSLDELQDETDYTSTPDYCDLDPTPGDYNDTTPENSCSGVPSNKSYARIPDGTGNWIDPIPTPGGTNATPENLEIAKEAENQENILEPESSLGVPKINNNEVSGVVEEILDEEENGGEIDEMTQEEPEENIEEGSEYEEQIESEEETQNNELVEEVIDDGESQTTEEASEIVVEESEQQTEVEEPEESAEINDEQSNNPEQQLQEEIINNQEPSESIQENVESEEAEPALLVQETFEQNVETIVKDGTSDNDQLQEETNSTE